MKKKLAFFRRQKPVLDSIFYGFLNLSKGVQVKSMHSTAKNNGHEAILRTMVFSLLTENERTIVVSLLNADHPLSLPEIRHNCLLSYRTIKRLVNKLEEKMILKGYRDVIKVVELNEILMEEKE